MSKRLQLGTRGSPLALWQAHWVEEQLKRHGVDVELIRIETSGDVRSGPIGQIGSQGVFTKEIQRALLDGEIDLAVHSLKDLPTEPIDGLKLAAVPHRGPQFDALIATESESLDQLPSGARIGTGSLRRRTQLLHLRSDFQLLDIRGNVETRLKKLDEGEFDAIVLAEAGLTRLGLADRIQQVLQPPTILPAIGQGALGLEIRQDDEWTHEAIMALDDSQTHAAVLAERALLAALRGGCLAPVGGWGRMDGDQLLLDGVVLSGDGQARLHASGSASCNNASNLGVEIAQQLLDAGAEKLIHAARAGELGGMRDDD